jgi:hypothetical protein
MSRSKYSFVTVVYEQEYDFLLLQARSIRIYCEPDIVESIIIIDNFKSALSPRQRERLRTEYGNFSVKVEFINARDIVCLPQMDGWWSQQILKLMISDKISCEKYLILDAKTHLIFPLKAELLHASNNLPFVNVYEYHSAHPIRPYIERSRNYLGIQPSKHLDTFDNLYTFTTSVPPFIMYTDIVRRMIDELSQKSGMTFPDIVISNKLTEFILYTSYIIHKNIVLRSLYEFSSKFFAPTIWEHKANENGCLETISEAIEHKTPFFAVHKLAVSNLNRRSRRIVADFWYRRSLFTSEKTANSFLVRFRRKHRIDLCIRYINTLPRRATRFAARKLRSITKRDR